MSIIILFFTLSLVANIIWEKAHSVFYTLYKGKTITSFVLFRAALFDASILTLTYVIYDQLNLPGESVVVLLVIYAFLLEYWALATRRWGYKTIMPRIPFTHIGITPVVQLAVTWSLTLALATYILH